MGRCRDGKTCRQGLAADGSPVQMLNVFLQEMKLALDAWPIGGDKKNEPGCLQRHLAELLDALKTCFAEATMARPAHETTEKKGIAAIPAGFGAIWPTPSISASV